MVGKLNQEINSNNIVFNLIFNFVFKLRVFVYLIYFLSTISFSWAQTDLPVTDPAANPAAGAVAAPVDPDGEVAESINEPIKILDGAIPNKRRIRRHLSLIKGIKIDEEILIPNVPLKILPLGQNLINIVRIKESDIFRVEPLNVGSGIVTIHNRKTGQIYAELHLDVRDAAVDKTIRDLKALLVDIEGLEYKAVNGTVIIDGYVMLPQDLNRLGSVIATYGNSGDAVGGVKVKSLVTLSPLARKRIVDYISREINNPEVTITVVGDYIKLEGTVNSQEEKNRIQDLVAIYLPASVNSTTMGSLPNLAIKERTVSGGASDFILNLITVRKAEEKDDPPEKMIQVVVHFVEFSERYLKSFMFNFSPVVSATSAAQLGMVQQQAGQNSIESLSAIVQNLLPKMNWAKTHGFLRVLDSASILTENNKPGSIVRNLKSTAGQKGGADLQTSVKVTPQITQPRAGLVKMALEVSSSTSGDTVSPSTNINTTITVRDRQSAAFGGIISKASANEYGLPADPEAIITLTAAKKYRKDSGNFVVFVTPIIKSSASAGVEQVKKKFRLKE